MDPPGELQNDLATRLQDDEGFPLANNRQPESLDQLDVLALPAPRQLPLAENETLRVHQQHPVHVIREQVEAWRGPLFRMPGHAGHVPVRILIPGHVADRTKVLRDVG